VDLKHPGPGISQKNQHKHGCIPILKLYLCNIDHQSVHFKINNKLNNSTMKTLVNLLSQKFVLFLFITFLSFPGLSQQIIQGTWGTQADSYRGQNGQRFTIAFPAGGTVSSRLWGTDLYTDDSSIGAAAIHAGLISARNGGTVTIEIRPGAAAYTGSIRNGVTSREYGAFSGSFVFVATGSVTTTTVTPVNAIQGTWGTQADSYRGQNGQRFTISFPAGGTVSGRLWGTDLYTDDSSIGAAAIHAGLISARNGGTVTIEIRPGASAYTGSKSNGVDSKDWGPFSGSFVFVRP
jgi:hypothetical protein